MYFGLSEEQESIQDFVKKFLDDNATVGEIRKIANGEGEEIEKNIFNGILNLGINTLLVIPGNMYGEFDNFKLDESHVIPALIRRFYEAKILNKQKVKIWGSGKAIRDFVYAGDVAKNIINLMQNNKSYNFPINISSGSKTSIKKLVNLIRKKIQYRGEIFWDISKPEGQLEKIFSVNKLKKFNKKYKPLSLEDGLDRTIFWFAKEYDKKSKRLRI